MELRRLGIGRGEEVMLVTHSVDIVNHTDEEG